MAKSPQPTPVTALSLFENIQVARCLTLGVAESCRQSQPLNFLSTIVRDFVAIKYLSGSAASSPPTPSSSACAFGAPQTYFQFCYSFCPPFVANPFIRKHLTRFSSA